MEVLPEFFHDSYSSPLTPEKHSNGGDHFAVEDLLDFSNDDDAVAAEANFTACDTAGIDAVNGASTDSSNVTVVDNSCNSSSLSDPSLTDDHFSGDLCVPYDDLAELEWLSNFVEEESFSSEDLQKLQLISGTDTRPVEVSEVRPFQPEPDGKLLCYDSTNTAKVFTPEMVSTPVPAKARSKRSRAAPNNWASRLLMLSPAGSSSDPEYLFHPNSGKKTIRTAGTKRKDNADIASNGEGRKCLHCATDKTPQWRTGPMGPKTLCNACGVRFKSGRLVPEYRPASSPTFVVAKHSNSHRKVIELRRQKEMMRGGAHHHQPHQFIHQHPNMMYDVSDGEDYFVTNQHVGPDYMQLE